MFIQHKIKNSKDKDGVTLKNPFLRYNLRLELISYIILAILNSPEDTNPCPNIIKYLPPHPIILLFINPPISSPICPTDEYAISDFTSIWRIQIKLVIKAPHIEILVNVITKFKFPANITALSRSNPYPPSLSKIPARIIDPDTGASTWALGNHKCVKYIGIFTINAIMKINHKNLLFLANLKFNMCIFMKILPPDEYIYSIPTSKGNDALIVYIIK